MIEEGFKTRRAPTIKIGKVGIVDLPCGAIDEIDDLDDIAELHITVVTGVWDVSMEHIGIVPAVKALPVVIIKENALPCAGTALSR